MKRTFVDRDPGLLRPWIAKDEALLRFWLVGGGVPSASLGQVAEIAEQFGDGHVYLTSRANLQIRGLPHDDGSGGVAHRSLDVGLVALDESTAQIRVGSHVWGETVLLKQLPFGSIAQRDGRRARHVEVVDGSLTLGAANRLAQLSEVLIVTQWRSIIAPDCAA